MRGLLACLSLALLTSLTAQRTEGAYRLQPEDVIRVQIVGEPEFSAPQLRISRDGRISLPSIGEIQAAGLTLTELEQRIRQRFREEQILRDALVAVTILEFHRPRVSVLGFVQRPGTYEFKEGDRVLEALSLGGGVIHERARLEDAWMQRIDGSKIELNLYRLLYEGDLSQNIPLQDGDTIYVPEETQNRYFVGGQVKRPGLYTWRPGLTVLDALSQAAWETERGRLSHTFVVRRKPDGSEERIRVDMVRLLNKGDMKQNIELLPGDVVFVSETNTPNFDEIYRVLSVVWILRQLDYGRALWRP
ncbi:MAG: polysaccharide biosynthesis/export family protein [Fimbriimonadales bacterium]|nr:polysaccharide biosynthesis/export family protein [Fimbriimonadales bacterium]